MSNGVVERWHRSLHIGLSHYVNAANTNWDTLVLFFMMAYRATPNTLTGCSPFFLLQGREMETSNNDNLKARVATDNPDLNRRLENLKEKLKTAYKLAAKANQRTHQANKRLYDRKAKERHFNVGDMVYLYNPTVTPGLTRNFRRPWTG
jgi:outer membrane murein-binding lipoprotein Lpp